MSSSRILLLATLASAVTLAACDQVRPLTNDGGDRNRCASCHGYPPPPGILSAATSHPNNTNCHACHPGTVDANGDIIPASAGGLHEDGVVEAQGHPSGFGDPALHGPAANGGIAACQACHGADYAGGTTGVSCNACHATMSFADWQTNCTFCHGEQTVAYAGGANPVKAAPPQDVAGSSATSSVGVGAHQRHLSSAIVAGGLACDACHVVPADLAHVKGQPAALTFSTFSGGAAASFDAASARCSNVYCHGATLGGGSAPAPKWTVVDGSQSTCGSCHGAPPASPHPASTITGCESCHAVSVDAQGNVLAGGKHLDGNVDATSPHPGGWASPTQHGYAAEASATSLAGCASCHAHQGYTSCTACHGGAGFSDWQTNCTFCHGTQTTAYAGGANPVKAAPPEGVHGEQLASDAHVGAHQRHLAATTYADPIACGTCHAVPADLSHITGTPATAFSGVAAGSTWNGTTCATYCHGATLPTGSGGGGTNETPSWTQSGVACNWCHSTSPTTGRHPAAFAKHGSLTCATCHGTGYSSTAVVRATHVNGTVEKAAFLNWNATNRTCSPGCHGTLSW